MDKIFLLLVLMMFMITALFAVSMPPSAHMALSPVPSLEGSAPDKPWFREAVLESPGNTLVFFNAPWCTACREMEPGLNHFVKEQGDTFKLVTVNSEQDRDLAQYYQADYIPYLMLFVDGKPVGFVQGAAPEEDLHLLLREYM